LVPFRLSGTCLWHDLQKPVDSSCTDIILQPPIFTHFVIYPPEADLCLWDFESGLTVSRKLCKIFVSSGNKTFI